MGSTYQLAIAAPCLLAPRRGAPPAVEAQGVAQHGTAAVLQLWRWMPPTWRAGCPAAMSPVMTRAAAAKAANTHRGVLPQPESQVEGARKHGWPVTSCSRRNTTAIAAVHAGARRRGSARGRRGAAGRSQRGAARNNPMLLAELARSSMPGNVPASGTLHVAAWLIHEVQDAQTSTCCHVLLHAVADVAVQPAAEAAQSMSTSADTAGAQAMDIDTASTLHPPW